jgi:hypothetical protein
VVEDFRTPFDKTHQRFGRAKRAPKG